MDINGKVIQLLALQTGEGKNGQWKKQDFVIETDGTYPKKVCISAWGDKIDTSLLKIGNMINVSFDVESREYNGRWYTDLRAWRIDGQSAGGDSSPSYAQSSSPAAPSAIPASLEGEDDLPF